MANPISDVASNALRKRLQAVAPFQPNVPPDPVFGPGVGATPQVPGVPGPPSVGPDPYGAPSPETKTWTTNPDYKGLITGDYAYQMALANLKAANFGAAGGRGSAVRNALIRFGLVPDFSQVNVIDPEDPLGRGFLDQDVNQTSRDLAAQNTAAGTSTVGQLNTTHGQNLANLRALMASRGILQSGQTALHERDEGRNYANTLDTAKGDLLSVLQQAQRDYLNTYASGQQSLAGITGQVTDRLQQTHAFDPTRVDAARDPGYTYNGGSVYKDANGNYWTGTGQAIGKNDLTGPSSLVPQAPAAPAAPPFVDELSRFTAPRGRAVAV